MGINNGFRNTGRSQGSFTEVDQADLASVEKRDLILGYRKDAKEKKKEKKDPFAKEGFYESDLHIPEPAPFTMNGQTKDRQLTELQQKKRESGFVELTAEMLTRKANAHALAVLQDLYRIPDGTTVNAHDLEYVDQHLSQIRQTLRTGRCIMERGNWSSEWNITKIGREVIKATRIILARKERAEKKEAKEKISGYLTRMVRRHMKEILAGSNSKKHSPEQQDEVVRWWLDANLSRYSIYTLKEIKDQQPKIKRDMHPTLVEHLGTPLEIKKKKRGRTKGKVSKFNDIKSRTDED